MDLKEIGKFIKEQRKSKNLTQAELAEKIMVSEKTISKWECGNGFPETSLMLPLCKELDITANELLSGKKLDEKEYKEKAEANLVNLQSQHEKLSKFTLAMEYVIIFTVIFFYVGLCVVVGYVQMEDWLRIVLLVVGIIPIIVAIGFCLMIEKDVGFYECAHCHNKYIPSYKQVLWSMHMGRTRYMKCPNCQKKSWQKKVIK